MRPSGLCNKQLDGNRGQRWKMVKQVIRRRAPRAMLWNSSIRAASEEEGNGPCGLGAQRSGLEL